MPRPTDRRSIIVPTVGADEYRSALDAQPNHSELRQAPLEVRDISGRTVAFRAVVFDSPSVDMGGWREVIKRGAFRSLLATKPDVRFLINHDGLPLARTTNGSLRLEEGPLGLDGVAELSDTQLSRDFLTAVERGDINQMSFLFRVAAGDAEWTYNEGDEFELRTVKRVAWLGEVSGVTFPAYEATSLQSERSEGADSQDATDDHAGELDGDAADERSVDDAASSPDAGVAIRLAAARRRRIDLLTGR